MEKKQKAVKLLKKIESIKQKIIELEEMRPGSLSKQYNVCGTPNCKCKDKEKPQKHGPYYQLSYTHKTHFRHLCYRFFRNLFFLHFSSFSVQ